MTVRKLTKDEKFSPSAIVNPDGKTVNVKFACRVNETSGDRYAISSTFDFSGVKHADIIELATRCAVIDVQRQWRVAAAKSLSTATANTFMAKIDVQKTVIDAAPRNTATPAQKVNANLAKLSAKERAEMLATLTALVNADKPTPRSNGGQKSPPAPTPANPPAA